MKILSFQTAAEAANELAERIISLIEKRPDAVLGLATGATMEPVYAALCAAHRSGRVSFRQVTSFNLDEYIGLPSDHPGSYRSTMNDLLFDQSDFEPSRTFLPDGMASDPERESAAYEDKIRQAGGIDLQILGIGRNGHIGFNEPGSGFDSRTRPVDLHVSTLNANARYFDGANVPQTAITMGLGTIMDAREIGLLATGPGKVEALDRALNEAPSPSCPASVLQRHKNVSYLTDTSAARLLKRAAEQGGSSAHVLS